MTLEQFKAVWQKAQAAIEANEKHFSELDAATGGDGDHGTAIVAAVRAINKAEGDDFPSLLADMAEKLETEASGSTSSLYGSWLEGMADAAPKGATELDADQLAEVFEAGFDEICCMTKARQGDKTMMDALQPATEALVAAKGEGEAAMFAAAAKAAREGSNATAQLQAKFGRAKNLGERSIGAIDAGSASMATGVRRLTRRTPREAWTLGGLEVWSRPAGRQTSPPPKPRPLQAAKRPHQASNRPTDGAWGRAPPRTNQPIS